MMAPPTLSLLPSHQPSVSEMHNEPPAWKPWRLGPHRPGGIVLAGTLRVAGKDSESLSFSGSPFWPRVRIALMAVRLLPKKQRHARNVARTAIGVESCTVEDVLVKKLPVVQVNGPDSILVKAAARQCVPAGVQLIAEGENDQPAFVIQEGHCNVMASGSVAATYGPGDIVGEKPLLLHGQHTSSVVTATDAVVYSIDHNLVKIELRRYQALDPAGYALFVKQVMDGSSTGDDVEVAGQPKLFYDRMEHMRKDFEKMLGHAIAGAYVMLSSLIAMILLPCSVTSVPAWWSVSVAAATVWISASGLKPQPMGRLQGLGKIGTFASMAYALVFNSYLILRGTWDNLHLSVPPVFDGPVLHLLDLTLAVASTVAVAWPYVRVAPERDLRIAALNVGQMLWPLCWVLFSSSLHGLPEHWMPMSRTISSSR